MNNPSSFSSISFEAETAIKFKRLAKDENKTHTKLLDELLWRCYKNSLIDYVATDKGLK